MSLALRRCGAGYVNHFSHLLHAFPNKKAAASGSSLFLILLTVLSHTSKALAAVNRSVRLGLKGNFRLAAAGSAGSGEVLSGATGSILASITAGLAALGLILEASLGIELLLTGSKNELRATFFAH